MNNGRSSAAIAAGIYFIVAGVLLLLDQLGVVPVSASALLALGLVALGIGVMLGAPDRGARESMAAGDSASVNVSAGGVKVTADSSSNADDTVEVEILAEEPVDADETSDADDSATGDDGDNTA